MLKIETSIHVFNKGGKTETQRVPLKEMGTVVCEMLSKHSDSTIQPESLIIEGETIHEIANLLAYEGLNMQEYSHATEFKHINANLDNDRSTLCIETHLIY